MLGTRFMIPKSWLPVSYDYYRPIPTQLYGNTNTSASVASVSTAASNTAERTYNIEQDVDTMDSSDVDLNDNMANTHSGNSSGGIALMNMLSTNNNHADAHVYNPLRPANASNSHNSTDIESSGGTANNTSSSSLECCICYNTVNVQAYSHSFFQTDSQHHMVCIYIYCVHLYIYIYSYLHI